MRDLVFAFALFGGAFYSLRAPWVGILGWTWVSMMNPHGLTWLFLNFPVAQTFAITTLLGMLFTKDPKRLVISREIVVLLIFMFWMSLSQAFSQYFENSLLMWVRVMKIDVMLIVSLMLLSTRQHILAFCWVVALSLAFYGVKGGIFTILTGGSSRVWGPAGGYIEGNNEIGLALVMTIPLLRFLQTTVTGKYTKLGLTGTMVLCGVAALGTHSRGALLAIAAMLLVLWWRSDKRMLGLLLLPVLAAAVLSFMPDAWWERMSTIKTYDQDDSAMGRINAWKMAWNLASAQFFGGGFWLATPENFVRYAPDPTAIHAAHSIYFMVLGEHGFVGLFLFVLLFWLTWRSAGRMRLQARKLPETRWLSDLASMCQVSLAGYAVGGAFLSLSYWDMPYNIMLMVVMGYRWMDGKKWLTEPKDVQPFEFMAPLMFWKKKKAKR